MEIILDANCSSIEKLVLLVIARHGRGKDGSGGFPSVRRIARIAGISTSTLHSVLGEMRKKKWLSWNPGSVKENKANEYTLHLSEIPLLPDLWRPVATTDTALSRFGTKPVSVAGHQASTLTMAAHKSAYEKKKRKSVTPGPDEEMRPLIEAAKQ